ncbi:bacillithiol system redox-active protein YtxJ [Maribacter sp. MAR_2009_72]|uniref:bacillithiol system redox-active protein YtxJ n=1 Tax=Maribacter sp. MAR_2009_72 TaxID=1250050 RepID=UPI00119A38E0|nr:bacillithiol system redox-active protein YtxJ [Maribacter sp. MAR_2009_72]TVZ14433.1 bacillithiol system protein YtxJ [Maribacter sp. MAR_2009_72]
MGIFSGIFGGAKNEGEQNSKSIPWQDLTMVAQLEEIKQASAARPQVIFKHSTTCGISRMVLNMFKGNYKLDEGQMDFHFLDLLAYREVSNAIAATFNVMHQSPQMLIIKNGVVVYHNSHGAISDVELEEYV